MVYVRQTIVQDASSAMSRAVCIATRYSAVRRQFGAQNGGLETQVINQFPPYLMQQKIVLMLNKRINKGIKHCDN